MVYQGSKDGYDSKKFHNKFRGLKNTFMLCKSTKGFRFGGYRMVCFDAKKWQNDKGAYLFTLTYKHKVEQKNVNSNYSVYDYDG